MPSVIAGTLLIFVGYKWVAETFGKGAGMVTGCILAFAPPMVILSAQVRHYMPHALFVACSLYCLERALREKSRGWMRYFGVALLLAVLTRFLPADDPRLRATVLAIADELTVDGLVLRYRVEETDDGLSGEEGTFTICSFWLVSALVEIGEIHRAKHLCERLLSVASPLHLYDEEIEPRTGRHLCNFPQAFTHLALINAVVHVIRAEQDADSSGVFQPAHTPT